jgi:hypothetical protein
MRVLANVVILVSLLACAPAGSEDGETGTSGSGSTETDSETGSETGGEAGSWEVVLEADNSLGALMSVWGPSPDEVYVVGGQPMPSVGVALRFDGQSWSEDPLPADTPMLNWVYGVEGRTWAVGQGGTILTREAGAWTAEDSPTDRVLWGIWGASIATLWAVGGDGFSDAPVLLRRDGDTATWEEVAVPDLGVEAKGLFKIWGRAGDDVWIVGDLGASLHFDGSEWSAHPAAGGVDLISLWGSDAEGIVAVGGRASGRVARLDGQSWVEELIDQPGLNGVWIDPLGGITSVGVQGRILSIAPGSFEYELEDSPTNMVLHSVFGFSGGERYAVGGSLLMPPPHVGVLLRSAP